MSKCPMRGHFRYLRFKTFPMTPRTPQCKVFCPLLSSSEHSGVPEDSKSSLFPSVGLHPHTWPKEGCNTAHPSGTSERSFSPSPQVRNFFCICRFRKELGGLGDHRCQVGGKERPLRRQGKSSEGKESATKKLEHLSDYPLASLSNRAARLRDRCSLPRGGSCPRPIAIAN
jgi:hypothetical protein